MHIYTRRQRIQSVSGSFSYPAPSRLQIRPLRPGDDLSPTTSYSIFCHTPFLTSPRSTLASRLRNVSRTVRERSSEVSTRKTRL